MHAMKQSHSSFDINKRYHFHTFLGAPPNLQSFYVAINAFKCDQLYHVIHCVQENPIFCYQVEECQITMTADSRIHFRRSSPIANAKRFPPRAHADL